MSPDKLQAYNLESKCTECGNHEHWAFKYGNNGTILDGLPSIQPQIGFCNKNPVNDRIHGNQNGNDNNGNELNVNNNGGKNDNRNILN